LAAAFARRPITQVYLWLTDPTDDEAVHLLQSHDFPLSARPDRPAFDDVQLSTHFLYTLCSWLNTA
jgi:hypothetical protein